MQQQQLNKTTKTSTKTRQKEGSIESKMLEFYWN